MPATDLLLFESPPPGKIRLLTWFSALVMVCCVPSCFFIFSGMTRDELSPELAPLAWRIGTVALVAGLGGGFFAGMLLYLTYYTMRLTLVAGTDLVRVETLRLFGSNVRTLAPSQIESASYHRGKFANPHGVSVNAPWFWVTVKGGKGFLLDAQGKFSAPRSLGKILSADHTRPIGGDDQDSDE